MKRSDPIVTRNLVALGAAIAILLAIVGILQWVFTYDEGLLFGMMLGAFFPGLVLLFIAGAVGYVWLLASNIRVMVPLNPADTTPKQQRRVWFAFVALTVVALLIMLICSVITMPIMGGLAKWGMDLIG